MSGKQYNIGGHVFTFGVLTFGQFEAITPYLGDLGDALNAIAESRAAEGPAAMLKALGRANGSIVGVLGVLAGPEIDIKALPFDPVAATAAIAEVLTSSGLIRSGPAQGGAPARPKTSPRKTARKSGRG